MTARIPERGRDGKPAEAAHRSTGADADGGVDTREELAEHRTDWAKERTLLAKERTFSAWTRTGISSMAAGLAIARLLDSVTYPWAARVLGVVLIVIGWVIFGLGLLSYRKALKKLADAGVRGTPAWIIGTLTVGLMLSAAIALFLIFAE